MFTQKDVLSPAFCYVWYTKSMENLTEFGMKKSLALPSLSDNIFNSLRDEKDEPLYTFNVEDMLYFVRKSIGGVTRTA